MLTDQLLNLLYLYTLRKIHVLECGSQVHILEVLYVAAIYHQCKATVRVWCSAEAKAMTDTKLEGARK
jgi:hypothetical protein